MRCHEQISFFFSFFLSSFWPLKYGLHLHPAEIQLKCKRDNLHRWYHWSYSDPNVLCRHLHLAVTCGFFVPAPACIWTVWSNFFRYHIQLVSHLFMATMIHKLNGDGRWFDTSRQEHKARKQEKLEKGFVHPPSTLYCICISAHMCVLEREREMTLSSPQSPLKGLWRCV